MAEILYKGIDVSHHNGTIDWAKVKNSGNVQFAIIRAGFGKNISQKDKQFERNYIGCKENNIPVGAYWYSYAGSAAEALQEAKICLEVLKGKQFEYPILFDIEESSQVKLGKDICSEICKSFCNYLEQNGYYAGIYTFDSFANTNLTESVKNRYTMAVARVDSNPPKYSPYDIWQYSWKGKINGISGDVDMDYCYRDFNVIKENGLNGFEIPVKDTDNINLKYDVNGDGKVTSEDALAILGNVVGK